jgi:hypothetical protein
MPYTFTREAKTSPKANRVQVSSLDPEWVAALEAEWAAHQQNPEVNHVVDVGDPKLVTRHASHARAWGLSRQGEKVNVRKLPARDNDSASILRISMDKYDPNAPKLGRKTNAEKAAASPVSSAASQKPANKTTPKAA